MTMLTRVTLNPADRNVRRIVRNPEAIHAVVAATTEGTGRPLWRLEGDRVYILSDRIDPDRLAARLAHPAIASINYDRLLDAITTGGRWGFHLTAAPARRSKSDGRIHTITDPAARLEWLRRKLADAGATTITADVTASHAITFRHGTGRPVTIGTAECSGTITVTDPDLLRHALTHGIGRGKAYGHGLLMIAPCPTPRQAAIQPRPTADGHDQ